MLKKMLNKKIRIKTRFLIIRTQELIVKKLRKILNLKRI